MTERTGLCQSCGMPLTSPELYGTEQDGSRNDDYCVYCYADGAFVGGPCSMEQMVEQCIPYALESGVYPDAETARAQMLQFFPALKRWRLQA